MWTGSAADYEYLYGHHPAYFKSQEEVRAAVELVLSKPKKVKDLNGNLSFVGFDEITGKIYRLEISPLVKNKANFVRSIFEISAKQYQKNKLAESPVLQPASTEDKQSAIRTLSNFMHNVPQNSDNASGKGEKYRGEEFDGTWINDKKKMASPRGVEPLLTG